MPIDLEANKICREVVEALLLAAKLEVKRLEVLLAFLKEVSNETEM